MNGIPKVDPESKPKINAPNAEPDLIEIESTEDENGEIEENDFEVLAIKNSKEEVEDPDFIPDEDIEDTDFVPVKKINKRSANKRPKNTIKHQCHNCNSSFQTLSSLKLHKPKGYLENAQVAQVAQAAQVSIKSGHSTTY